MWILNKIIERRDKILQNEIDNLNEIEKNKKSLISYVNTNGRITQGTPEDIKIMKSHEGLFKYVTRCGVERWGTQDDVECWEDEDLIALNKEKEEEKNKTINQVINHIENFESSIKWKSEEGYHAELQGYLKNHFPNAEVEVQTGASRPDIVIDNIAIEIKGVTDNSALNSIAGKIFKYSNYYDYIIIVIFEKNFSEPYFNEILAQVDIKYPNVKIIIKD